jgi:crotonobetaine/carnitine-CoA ligase
MISDRIPETTLWAAFEQRIQSAGNAPLITDCGADWTARQLKNACDELAGRLAMRGLNVGSTVMTMLPNCVDHIILLLAVARLGAVWAAVPPDQRGPALDHVIATLNPDLIVASPESAQALENTGVAQELLYIFDPQTSVLADLISEKGSEYAPYQAVDDDVRAIVFTSGTTGPPKGAQVTERMLMASAWGVAHAADVQHGDRFLLWEPLYHVGGCQMLALALLMPIRLFVVSRFSARRFWQQVRQHEISKLHYLGGILEILLSQPVDPSDSEHAIKMGFGAGLRAEIKHQFEKRFGIALREVYGLTEASSFTTINHDGHVNSIGRPVPWVEVILVDEKNQQVPNGEIGEIVVKPKLHGLLTPGYLGNPEATAELLRDGCLYTGDLARWDKGNGFQFVGRRKDAIRRRGEIVSAWEIETALMDHPHIVECAALGVPAAIGEEDIFVFVRAENPDFSSLAAWAEQALPKRSRPRYWCSVNDFPRTSSARIAKTLLRPDVENAYDSQSP